MFFLVIAAGLTIFACENYRSNSRSEYACQPLCLVRWLLRCLVLSSLKPAYRVSQSVQLIQVFDVEV